MKIRYITLSLIILSIILPISLRFTLSSMYPHMWVLFVIPSILIPNWRASITFLVVLTLVEYGLEFFLQGEKLFTEPLFLFLGATAVNIFVFFAAAALHHQNKHNMRNLHKQTLIDPLTGAYNRRFLESYMKKVASTRVDEGKESFLMILDVDHFKKLNDMYGNLFADEVLKQVSAHIRKVIRETDLLVRMGGEEFVILLPQTDLDYASHLANRIQSVIGETRFSHKEQGVYVTISLGMAPFVFGQPMDQVIEKADQALYQAKVSGRNRVVIAAS